ncbi:ribosomal RNA processing protein 36 homolog [Melanaphis sacchari]|uniref:ribosomal RNA processing protein 36 homolog n=1 Tax=Melanaphis sacchari TaxID=742174 RepID=UPI000DC1413E|nr:ribosomal RNA processing protein 36 homolog [Melanaphis sacchari]
MNNLTVESEIELKQDLKKLSLEELRKLKEKIGNEVYQNATTKKSKLDLHSKSVKRKNKNRPSEISSKLNPFLNPIKNSKPKIKTIVKETKCIDPRFDSLYENQDREKQKLEAQEKLKLEQRQKRLDAIKEGKKPQFLKKRESKILHLVGQYEDLKSQGKLTKHIKQKRIRINF